MPWVALVALWIPFVPNVGQQPLGGGGTFLVAAAFTAIAALLLAAWRPAPRAAATTAE